MKKIDKKELHSIFTGIQNHNEFDFNRLYQNYKNLIYGIIFSILKNKEDSEEVVQIVFLKIFKLKKEQLPNKNEASWLYSITKNETLNFLRNKRKEINIDELYCISSEDNQLNEIIDRDTYNRIVEKLQPKDQEIVSLKILSDLSFKDISNVLNIPIGTVQWRYYKAIHTLKTLIGSLSMYILTICIFIIQRTKRQKNTDTEEIIIKENEVKQEVIKEEFDTETKKSESLREDVNTTIDNIEGEHIESIITVQEDDIKMNLSDIGLITISNIFLIIVVTFFIVFITHQYRAKKNKKLLAKSK